MISIMHDWTLTEIRYSWSERVCYLVVRSPSLTTERIVCREPITLNLTQEDEWGESVSINSIEMKRLSNGYDELCIEMQSGDSIYVRAKQIILPNNEQED